MNRVLIIDDDESVLAATTRILTDAGYDIMTASGGCQGIETLRETTVDLVITDVFMADMDGMEVIREIRRNSPDTKVIAISGGSAVFSENYLPYAEKLGAQCSLEKPFSSADLLAAMQGLLSNRVKRASP
jgi:DNA-binding NtrC family response regulator